MNEDRDNQEPEFDDPDEQQRFENELMKLKLQAEHGAVIGGDLSELPPGVEAEFLRNIAAFQETIGSNSTVTMLEALGNPVFPAAGTMDPDRLESAWETLDELLDEHGFAVEFLADYPTEVKYRFVTEELVHSPVMWPMPEGMTMHSVYEEFHPNHAWDIENRTRNFLEELFGNNAEGVLELLSDTVSDGADGGLDRQSVLPLVEEYLQLLGEVVDWEIIPADVSFELGEKEQDEEQGDHPESDEADALPDAGDGSEPLMMATGLGHCAGEIRIRVRRGEETEEIVGPFKLFFELESAWWSIFHFTLPGWRWS